MAFLKISFFLTIILFSQNLSAQDWGNWNNKVPKTISSDSVPGKKNIYLETLHSRFIEFYQAKVSPMQGAKCPASPSCSVYTYAAMNKFRFAQGFIMGLERIYFRENRDMKSLIHYFSIVTDDNKYKIYDPVDANNIFGKKTWQIIDPPFADGN